jgi:hypothetical protein
VQGIAKILRFMALGKTCADIRSEIGMSAPRPTRQYEKCGLAGDPSGSASDNP